MFDVRRSMRVGLLLTAALTLTTRGGMAAPPAQPLPIGPGSAAWTSDLRSLSEAVENDATDVPARIKAFFATHEVKWVLMELPPLVGYGQVGLHGRSSCNTDITTPYRFMLDAIAHSPYRDLIKYGKTLRRLLPDVHAGKITLEEARRRAARWLGFTGLLDGRVGLEIAEAPLQRGIWMSHFRQHEDEPIELLGPEAVNWKPDQYKLFEYTWDILESRVVLDSKGAILEIDDINPKAGQRTVVRLLDYLGEVGPAVPPQN